MPKSATAVANSSLFKTAMYSRTPTGGRILAAIGSTETKLTELIILYYIPCRFFLQMAPEPLVYLSMVSLWPLTRKASRILEFEDVTVISITQGDGECEITGHVTCLTKTSQSMGTIEVNEPHNGIS